MARHAARRRLEAEQKKFAAGLSTNYLVFQAQRDLADAQYSELVALLDYNKSLVDFETVQEAPTAGSVVLAGVLLKMGTYGLMRFSLPLFPDASRQLAPFVLSLAVIGIIYGAVLALALSQAGEKEKARSLS